mgnify:CR=1 FL=1
MNFLGTYKPQILSPKLQMIVCFLKDKPHKT